jgi:ferric-dicitrate binding protein FerR (iron transport regulator)
MPQGNLPRFILAKPLLLGRFWDEKWRNYFPILGFTVLAARRFAPPVPGAALGKRGLLSGEVPMRTLYRILCVLTISTMISGSALLAQTQQDDQYDDQPAAADQQNNNQAPIDQQYNRDDNQPAPADQQASPPDSRYDQNSDDQRYDQNQTYDQDDNQAAQPDRAAPDPRNEQGPRAEDQPLETPQYDARNGAPQNNSEATTPDPPSRAARLQFTTGSVSIQPQGTGDWVTGEINRPLTNSDNIWADKDSRAEISVGSGIVRIGSESSLTITDISDNLVQLQLHQGELILHVRRLEDGEKYEVDTPNQAFTALKPGDYRFDVDSNADKTIITVWRGEGESTGDGPAVRVRANEQVRFSNGTSMTVDSHAAPAPDAFDQWASNRDNRFDHSESARYVSPDVVGSDDLDEYGTWRNTPDYGDVWTPAVAPGWSPYTNGHWIYQYPWGWTWVEYEPWGYAPFHYGRWVYAGGFWGWAPGPYYARPYYAPALVAWFGGGFGFGVGFGGGFGWCPLGFGEPFIPWYGVSFGYFSRVNFRYNRFGNLNHIYGHNFNHGRLVSRGGERLRYANMHNPGGFTAVSRDTLVNSRSVSRNNLRVSPSALSRMSAVHSPGIAPSRATMTGSRGGRAAVPPQRAFARPVVSRSTSPSGNRGSFNSGMRVGNARPGSMMRPSGEQRSMPAAGNRGSEARNNVRPPQDGAMDSRAVSRPQNSNRGFGRGANADSMNSRPSAPQTTSRNNVPRPPNASMGRGESSYSRSPSSSGAYNRGGSYSGRPSGNRSGAYSRSSYGAGSYGRPAPSYNGGRSPAYGGGAYGRPAPSYGSRAPGYGGGSYGRPAPSYGGGRSPSYGGGRAAPSYGGGGGHSGGFGGGGHAPSGGGGHSGGGAGGGSHSSGGGHSGGGHR